jgi:hypothetical protein
MQRLHYISSHRLSEATISGWSIWKARNEAIFPNNTVNAKSIADEVNVLSWNLGLKNFEDWTMYVLWVDLGPWRLPYAVVTLLCFHRVGFSALEIEDCCVVQPSQWWVLCLSFVLVMMLISLVACFVLSLEYICCICLCLFGLAAIIVGLVLLVLEYVLCSRIHQ